MTLNINLGSELERQLRDEAARLGLNPGDYAAQAIQEHLRPRPKPAYWRDQEKALLESVNIGLSQERWRRYHDLIARRQAETLTEPERREFISISDELECANVKRLETLGQLSRLRGVPLRELMSELGLLPNAAEDRDV